MIAVLLFVDDNKLRSVNFECMTINLSGYASPSPETVATFP